MNYISINNKIYNCENIYIVKNGEILKDLIFYNQADIQHTRHDGSIYLFNTYYKMQINKNIKKITKKTLQKNIHGSESFLIATNKDYSGVRIYDLYINCDLCDYTQEDDKINIYEDGQKIQHQRKYKITFNKNVLIVYNSSDYYFANGSDPVQPGDKETEEISERMQRFEEMRRKHLSIKNEFFINELKNAQKENKKYIVYFTKKATTNTLYIYSYCYKTIKSKELLKIEKLSNNLSKLLNINFSTSQIKELLKNYKITKRRNK